MITGDAGKHVQVVINNNRVNGLLVTYITLVRGRRSNISRQSILSS
ncbi:MAG: hypothetical protein WDN26_08975 [Chitinophagaceae bacterium]